eukprot:315660_1
MPSRDFRPPNHDAGPPIAHMDNHQNQNAIPFDPSIYDDQLNEIVFSEDKVYEKVHYVQKRCALSRPLIIVISTAKRNCNIFSESMRNDNRIIYIAVVGHQEIRQAVLDAFQRFRFDSGYDSVILFPVCILSVQKDNDDQDSFSPQYLYDQNGEK